MEEGRLAAIIKEIVQNQKFERLQQIYIVDKQTGPYRSIQEAIDEASPGSLIKISEGLYDETLVINKPLTFEPKLYNSSSSKDKLGVILLVSSGHALTLDIPEEGTCVMRGFKISHSGNTFLESFENQLLENEEIMKLFEKKQGYEYTLETEYVNKSKAENIENMVLHAVRGRIVMESCLLSLAYIVKSCKNLIPAVYVEKEAELVMSNCQVKGNSDHSTIGILSKLGKVEIKNCKVSSHKLGGIVIWSVATNTSRIMSSQVEDCSVGIHLVGEENGTLVIQNTISKCKSGLKLGIGVKAQISGNLILENAKGVEAHSCFPLILKNRIEKNEEEGILVRSHKKLRCMATIKKNYSIVGNGTCGIHIEGCNNFTRVIENHLIGFNAKSGIRVSKQAHPHILLNKIYKNLSDGILLVEGSSAIIQRNEILSNVRMNIGLGGERSSNTVILENNISGSRGQGIFLVECSKSMICRNDITNNNDGIVAITSVPIIKRNYLAKNRSNGIVMLKNAQANISENLISENEAVGLYLRDRCYGEIDSNVINGNEIDVATQRIDHRCKELSSANTISGQLRTPKKVGCNIF